MRTGQTHNPIREEVKEMSEKETISSILGDIRHQAAEVASTARRAKVANYARERLAEVVAAVAPAVEVLGDRTFTDEEENWELWLQATGSQSLRYRGSKIFVFESNGDGGFIGQPPRALTHEQAVGIVAALRAILEQIAHWLADAVDAECSAAQEIE